ncbi:hypothetical protein HMPREF9446_02621 [Bacteroides fluxus YIT 12057]|uniref:Uncharacterized protein n=1 Tax=Bacteroides fluxus YIT 12057 TaxID=763034 RepID=F3PV47_9BACE|nr:hypothetical protein HMPREF9446_02621 [Bacteroides fluxus YIT 12057]
MRRNDDPVAAVVCTVREKRFGADGETYIIHRRRDIAGFRSIYFACYRRRQGKGGIGVGKLYFECLQRNAARAITPHQQVGGTVGIFGTLVVAGREFGFQGGRDVCAGYAVRFRAVWEVGEIFYIRGFVVVIEGRFAFAVGVVEAPCAAVVFIRYIVGQHIATTVQHGDADAVAALESGDGAVVGGTGGGVVAVDAVVAAGIAAGGGGGEVACADFYTEGGRRSVVTVTARQGIVLGAAGSK